MTSKRWTPEEDQVIVDNFPSGGSLKCFMLLPDRTVAAVANRAVELGVRFKRPGRPRFAGEETCNQPGAPGHYQYEWQPLDLKAVDKSKPPLRAGANDWKAIPSLK